MNDRLPTVKVKMKGSKSKETFVINMTDFDENKHEMVKGGEDLPPMKPTDTKPEESLFGSTVQPSTWTLKDGSTLQLGDVVAEAHKRSGLSIEDWNKLTQDDREGRIATVVSEMVPSEPSDYKVINNGKRGNARKFRIVDANGAQIGEEFETEEAANEELAKLQA